MTAGIQSVIAAAPETVREALRRAQACLAGCVEDAPAEAEILLAAALERNRAWLIAHDDESLPPPVAQRYAQWIERRRRGEPVAYLTGEREFWSLPLRVTSAVLIPRPETETLVAWALERLADLRAPCLADLGTGSGAIALALARERPDARVIATDLSTAALAVARDNARRLALANVEFRAGDWCAPLAGERCDLIVSNPPYVAQADPRLAQLRCEPPLALVAGTDGLAALRAIAATARASLRAGGWLLLEHGAEQGAAVRALLRERGYAAIETRRDLAGLERATGARAP
ncbi:MAG: peptide chain release factor N(5)-glutamine methyltransferase [Nevskia sp.]|nr:peptide chain release factor N(5)-glutamine methyltransferase [Nevskia sp.]